MRHAPEERRGRRRPYGYYGVPPIHKPHWKWLIVSYFFLGGLSAGSSVVATAAETFGDQEDADTVRVGRYVALLALLPCPILLILDLGRPERFYTMLRVFKLRSPMSLGTWGLMVFGMLTSLSGATQAGRDGVFGGTAGPCGWGVWLLRAVPARLIGLLTAPFGFFVGGYAGVLLGATAVPIWAKNVRLLGPLFLSSAAAAGCAAISLVLALLPGRQDQRDRREALERLHRAETVAAAGELAAYVAIHLNSGRLGAPLTDGRLGQLHLGGSLGLGIAFPIALHWIGARLGLPHRLVMILATLASLVGGFIVKYAVVMAGHESADDPVATFEFAGGHLPESMTPDRQADSRARQP
jgi:formate-dependent nitrite reductase membrane component NrfD